MMFDTSIQQLFARCAVGCGHVASHCVVCHTFWCHALQVKAARQSESHTDSLRDAKQRTAPEEGARDLAVIEALLQSSELAGKAVQVTEIPEAS